MTPSQFMTRAQVAEELQLYKRDGTTIDRDAPVKWVKAGKRFPTPLDDSLPPMYWRWSRAEIEAYANKRWRPEEWGTAS